MTIENENKRESGPILPIIKRMINEGKQLLLKAGREIINKLPVKKISFGNFSFKRFFKRILEKILDISGLIWNHARRVSFDKALAIWALAIISGLLMYNFFSKELPGIQTNLVFATWWEDTLESQTLTELIAKFEAQNPGITVTLERMDWNEIWESLENGEAALSRASGGEPGLLASAVGSASSREAGNRNKIDIFSIDSYGIYEIKNHLYMDTLETNLAAQQETQEDFLSNVMPVISFINPLFYNIDLLETAGFYRPPKNQTEFLSYVQRLRETGVHGAGLALSETNAVAQQILSWIWSAAGTPESNMPPDLSSREVVASLNFLNQLNQNLYTNPFFLSKEELLDAFAKGQLGMMIGSIEDVRKLKTMDINFGITTIPSSESYTRKPVFLLSEWYLGINRQSSNPEDAQKFIAFIRENAENIAHTAYAIPGNGRRSRELSRNDPFYAKAFDMYEGSDMVREIYFSNISGLNRIIRSEIELLFRGEKTVAQSIEAIQEAWLKLSDNTAQLL